MRRWLAWLVALLALGYLGLMAAMGAMPVQRQLVRSEANGLLTLAPEQIRRVVLDRDGRHLELRRDGEGWRQANGAALDAAASQRVSMAVQVMHRSAPVREIAAEELAGIDQAPFGLATPGVVAALYGDGDKPVLTARFGGRNAEDNLQYMRLDGDQRLYLMSLFVGQAWQAVAP